MRKRWIIKDGDPAKYKKLAESLNILPIIAELLVKRGVESPKEAHQFLNGNLSSLHSPTLLKGMDKAVSRIRRALSKGEKVLVYGDYDVDGITSVALLSRVLKKLGGHVIEYIPSRLKEGYGLNLTAAKLAHRKKTNLLITVDCGISSLKEVDYLNSLNIDTIVVDHHRPDGDKLPEAHAIIDPFQKGCSYPFKGLAGVGLVFKLIQSLLDKNPAALREHLDLVALGTVSDVVPMLDENRILVRFGLESLMDTKKLGIKELIHVSSLKGKELTAGHIGYILGPRINASGRIGSPELALKLLTTKDPGEARELAVTLNKENRSRQKIEREVYEMALDKASREVNFKDHRVIVLSGEGWHAGVIGIVASRFVDRFYRPTVMISINDNVGRGSARSIKNFHLFDAISGCKEYLDSFGGHKNACGITIVPKFIDKFRRRINEQAHNTLAPEDLLPSLDVDMEIPLDRLSGKLINQLEKLSPFGQGNPRPVFVSRSLTVKNNPKLIGRKGAKIWVTNGRLTCEALIFGAQDTMNGISRDSVVNLAYSPVINEWGGVRSIQLNLEDIKYSS